VGKKMLKLYYRLIKASFKSQMQYKASFIMISLASFISIFMDFIGVWVLFSRFKTVKGWTFDEVLLLYGIIHIGFSIAEAFARSFDKFSLILRRGDFDRILLRPLGSLFQVAASEVQVTKMSRTFQGLIILIIGYIRLNLSFFSIDTLMVLFSIIGTISLFYGIFIIQASLVFWTKESLEVMNIATYGAREVGQYPMSIYNTVFRIFFTVVLPLACVGYFPVASFLHHDNISLKFGLFSPIIGFVFLLISYKFWKKGVKHYCTFGN
jgi:ABC-2 type transport system permease protein